MCNIIENVLPNIFGKDCEYDNVFPGFCDDTIASLLMDYNSNDNKQAEIENEEQKIEENNDENIEENLEENINIDVPKENNEKQSYFYDF